MGRYSPGLVPILVHCPLGQLLHCLVGQEGIRSQPVLLREGTIVEFCVTIVIVMLTRHLSYRDTREAYVNWLTETLSSYPHI